MSELHVIIDRAREPVYDIREETYKKLRMEYILRKKLLQEEKQKKILRKYGVDIC
jgi:hypothetical protein